MGRTLRCLCPFVTPGLGTVTSHEAVLAIGEVYETLLPILAQ
jgi:hypothetical protein